MVAARILLALIFLAPSLLVAAIGLTGHAAEPTARQLYGPAPGQDVPQVRSGATAPAAGGHAGVQPETARQQRRGTADALTAGSAGQSKAAPGTATGGGRGTAAGTLSAEAIPVSGAYTVLHTFTVDPFQPYGIRRAFDGNFYGVTVFGGAHNRGTVFMMTPDRVFTTKHSFTGADGNLPQHGLVERLSETLVSTFYGVTQEGGAHGRGTLFQMDGPTGAVTVLHHFGSITNDGEFPNGGLTLGFDSTGPPTLFGTTLSGGTSSTGTVFKYRLSGASPGYSVIHTFAAGTGWSPQAGVIQASDGKLYGTTTFRTGSPHGHGGIFRIDTDGTDYEILHDFAESTNPLGKLLEDPAAPGTFYGTGFSSFGPFFSGSAFKLVVGIEPVFTTLHTFTGGAEGGGPNSALVKRGSDFYGTTGFGGAFNRGNVFKMTASGTVTDVHSFDDLFTSSFGTPGGGLFLAPDSKLWGTGTFGGGTNRGAVFNVDPGVSTTIIPLPGTDGHRPSAGLVQGTDGRFYGTTRNGGTHNLGTAFVINADGTGYQVLYSFTGVDDDGAEPDAILLLAGDGNFYGTTREGGENGGGTIFRMTPTGAVTTLHSFQGFSTFAAGGVGIAALEDDGTSPEGGLIQATDGKLYGTTSQGGEFGLGIVFRMNTDGTGYEVLHSFDEGQPETPQGIIQGIDGKFYGTSFGGGDFTQGTVFKMDTATSAPVILHSFTFEEEGHPRARLVQAADGTLYGTAGGGEGGGGVFKITPAGAFTQLHSFSASGEADVPVAALIQASDGNLYGTAATSGGLGGGILFRITPAGVFTPLHSLDATGDDRHPGGSSPVGALVQGSDGKLYGTASRGGTTTGGVVFVLDAGLPPPTTGPRLTGVSVPSIGAGATVTVVLTGTNLNQFTYTGPNRAVLDFGPGITVVLTSIRVSSDGTSITVRVNVADGAPLGARDVRIIPPGGAAPIVLTGHLQITAAPEVTDAGTLPESEGGLGPLLAPPTGVLKGQVILVRGLNFQAPTSVPSNLLVSVSGTGITVKSVTFDQAEQIAVEVEVAAGAQAVANRRITVTNPDFGSVTSDPLLRVIAAGPEDSVPVGLAPTATSGTATTPPLPTTTSITPATAPTGAGATIRIVGTRFSATIANNFVTFTGAQQSRVLATILTATTSALTVLVPQAAMDGPVIVAVNGVQQAPPFLQFTSSNPVLTTATTGLAAATTSVTAAVIEGQPAGGQQGQTVNLSITGAKFQTGATVAFDPATGLSAGVPTVTSTSITVAVTIAQDAPLGLRGIVVRNPDGGASTLPQSFEVRRSSAFDVQLALTTIQGAAIPLADFLPSIDQVLVTLDATAPTGRCTARQITPTRYLLEARVAGAQPQLMVTLTSTRRPGTATNDDCEPNPTGPEPDWSVAELTSDPAGQPLDVTVQQAAMRLDPDGVYRVLLASWDWLGSVHIDVVNVGDATHSAGTIGTSLDLPFNTLPEGPTKTAADGLTDFRKLRGVYLKAPKAPATLQPLSSFTRLDRQLRNLFLRGRGYATDPAVAATNGGKCGINTITNQLVDPLVNPLDNTPMPCPFFQWATPGRDAFAEVGIKVWDVSDSFDAAGTTIFPTRSLANPAVRMLDLATVTYDTANCAGAAPCEHTTKVGPRNFAFPSLGFSTFPTCGINGCNYGSAVVIGRALRAYFTDRHYLKQLTPPGTFLPFVGDRAPLAPPTIVCDKNSTGADNGTLQTGECSVNGIPGGDVYRPGQYNLDGSVFDSNDDRCVELPFATVPLESVCSPGEDSAVFPQATFQQVLRHVTAHEVGHMLGSTIHTAVLDDLMYQFSINWIRDGHLSPQAGFMLKVINMGAP